MKQPNPNPKNALPIKKYPKKMFKRSDTVSEYMDDESTRKKTPRKKLTPHTTPEQRRTLERRPLPNGRATPRDKRILPRELTSPTGRVTPRDKRILPRELTSPTGRVTPRDKRILPRKSNIIGSTDSLNTSRFAGPFRNPKNLTDSLGTASPVARKYRKLGSK
jgi:hypothetical protein